ncbi:MAG: acetoin utilization protein AcuC, partial [Thaumarchaeota archaeon]|nr:acetoin utilization protein AcuC [Nitrososphaerota archaeon]
MCKVGVFYGESLLRYSFPRGHPLTSKRLEGFWHELSSDKVYREGHAVLLEPVVASENDLLAFHTKEYIDLVKQASRVGSGYLDYGDTPAFPGVFEASSYSAGST